MKQAPEAIQTIANLTIDRRRQTVVVDGMKVPTLTREYLLIDELAMTEGWIALGKIGRRAFANSELMTETAVKAIAHSLRAKLTTYRAERGLVNVENGKIAMFEPPAKVKVEAFTLSTANYLASPEGSPAPPRELTELCWFGEVDEMSDPMLLEGVFAILNQDDRPNGHFAPSLSVGDLVTIQPGTPEANTYQVADTSFRRMKGVIEADEIDRDTVARQLAQTAA